MGLKMVFWVVHVILKAIKWVERIWLVFQVSSLHLSRRLEFVVFSKCLFPRLVRSVYINHCNQDFK